MPYCYALCSFPSNLCVQELASRLQEKNILVNAHAPGAVQTNLLNHSKLHAVMCKKDMYDVVYLLCAYVCMYSNKHCVRYLERMYTRQLLSLSVVFGPNGELERNLGSKVADLTMWVMKQVRRGTEKDTDRE